MATMRDVAKLAGVSHGTVSNVLNGSQGVTLDKIGKVEEAMRQLGYKPNSLARSLKNRKVDQGIHVVMPNLNNSLFGYLFETINKIALDKGIRVNLCLTDDMPYRECQVLSNAQAFGMGSAIVVTCQPDNTDLFSKLSEESVKLVFLLREVAENDFLGLEIRNLIRSSVQEQVKKGANRIAIITGPQIYSFEAGCIDGYFNALFKSNVQIRNEYVKVTDNNVESYMRAANNLMNMQERPDVIYITDDHCADGVRQALSLSCMKMSDRPRLVIFSGSNWPSVIPGETVIPLPVTRLGEMAFSHMIDRINNDKSTKPFMNMINVPCPPKQSQFGNYYGKGRKIRVLLQSGHQVGESVHALADDFRARTGIEVEFELKKYGELLNTIENSHGDIDAFCTDLAWAPEMNNCGFVEPLEKYISEDDIAVDAFQNNVLREYCYYKNKMYALPYSYTAQLLYYRKDLFESLKNKRHFYELYKKNLRVPRTWEEYNLVARFFTRKYNPESETLYGTTLGGNEYNGAVCEFLPRMWGMAGTAKDGDWTQLNTSLCVNALKNYIDCFNYAPPEAINWWWNEESACFGRGDAAMMVLFSEHAASLWERDKDYIAGKIGHSLVPGGFSTLGGWGMAIHSESLHKEEAFEFAKWSCCIQMAMPSAAMGRILPYTSVRDSAELAKLYPWLSDAFLAFKHIGRRYLPAGRTAVSGLMPELERIIGRAVRTAIQGLDTPENTLKKADENLREILR